MSQVRASNPAVLTTSASQLEQLNQTFSENVTNMHRDFDTVVMRWQGDAAAKASTRAVSEHVAGSHIGTAVTAVIDVLTEAGQVLAHARQVVVDNADAAVHAGCIVDDATGHVRAPDMGSLPLQTVANDTAANQDAKLFPALATFNELDQKYGPQLVKAIEDIADLIKNPEPPPETGRVADILAGRQKVPEDPRQFHDFWMSLSPSEKDELWQHDQYLGNRDGMACVDRDRYNRIKLDDEYTRASAADAEVWQLTAQHPDWAKPLSVEATHFYETQPGYAQWKAEFDDAQRRAKFLPDLQQIKIETGPGKRDRMLLQLDTQTGQYAHTILATGNPDTAGQVATFVPGTFSQPRGMNEYMGYSDKMVAEAKNSGASNPVVVAWYGYDAPQSLVNPTSHMVADQHTNDAGDIRFADAAAPSLDRFQTGLRITHEGDPSYNTVIGHSYGTVVVGDAASHGHQLDTNSVVMLASPGTTVDHVGEMNLTGLPEGQQGQHVWSTKADNDPVPLAAHEHQLEGPIGAVVGGLVGGPMGAALGGSLGGVMGVYSSGHDHLTGPFGTDPTDSGFGGQVFKSDPGTRTPVVGYSDGAHTDYWNQSSSSLRDLGYLIAGNLGLVK